MRCNSHHLLSKFKLIVALLSPKSFFAVTLYFPASSTVTFLISKLAKYECPSLSTFNWKIKKILDKFLFMSDIIIHKGCFTYVCLTMVKAHYYFLKTNHKIIFWFSIRLHIGITISIKPNFLKTLGVHADFCYIKYALKKLRF